MAVPIIDPESSVLAYPQWVSWEHQFSASGSPYIWEIASGAFPTGLVFQPATSVTGEADDDTFTAADHGLVNGTIVAFSALSGGGGVFNTTTRYYVINATTNTFKLSTTLNGAAVTFTSDVTTGSRLVRPGFLTGAGTVSGVSTVRLIARNSEGDSAQVLFTIGIEPAAPALDANADLVWDIVSGNVSVQSTSVYTPPTAEQLVAPLLTLKHGDDFIARVRMLKGGSLVELNTFVDDSNFRLVVKENEPEGTVMESTEFQQVGTGGNACYLLYTKLDTALLGSALGNYEGDKGTSFDALAELEITYENPEAIGPALLVLTSRTFKLRIERDLAANAAL